MVKALNFGRLGNSYYQNSVAIAYALKHGLQFTVPDKTNNARWNPIYNLHLVNPKWDDSLETIVIKEKCHEYHEIPFEESWRNKNIILDGYWQSWKFIEPYREQILDLFGHKWEMKKNYVSVHIRKGDYDILVEKHPKVTKEWYDKAMLMFPGAKFKFFSDDIQYCLDNWGTREDCEFSTNINEVDDLVDASCCEHNICSSSTFSVWIHWLNRNPDKIGVFPDKWFCEGWCGLNTDDIVEPHCIKLPL